MITKEDIEEIQHILPEKFTGTFSCNKRFLQTRYGKAAIPRWKVSIKNGKTMSLLQTLQSCLRSKNKKRTMKECRAMVTEATKKDSLLGLFEIVKKERPDIFTQIESKFAICQSLDEISTSWWCNGLCSKSVSKEEEFTRLYPDVFCPENDDLISSREYVKKTIRRLMKHMEINVHGNYHRLYNAFLSAHKSALSSNIGRFKIRVHPHANAEEGVFRCTMFLDMDKSLVIYDANDKVVARVFDDGFAITASNNQHLVDFMQKMNDDDKEASFLQIIFQNVCTCIFCGRNLTQNRSIEQGSGDICYARYGKAWKEAMAKSNPVYTPGHFVDFLSDSSTKELTDGRTTVHMPTVICVGSPVIRMFLNEENDRDQILDYIRNTFSDHQLNTLAYYMENWLLYPYRGFFGPDKFEHKFYGFDFFEPSVQSRGIVIGNSSYAPIPIEPSNDTEKELFEYLMKQPNNVHSSFGYKREGYVLGYMLNTDMLKLIDYLAIPFVREHILFQFKPVYHAFMLDEYLIGNNPMFEMETEEKKNTP